MNIYYGPEAERLVSKYLRTNNERLFQEKIYPLLRKIAYGVCAGKRFEPVSLYRSPAIIDGCVSHLWECLRYNYDITKKVKSYSYLTACAFHFFCGVSKKYKKSKRTLSLVRNEVNQQWINTHAKINIETLNEIENYNRFYYELLMEALEQQRDKIKPKSIKKDISNSIIDMLRDAENIDEKKINKKALYSKIRRDSGATTKQIKYTIDKHLYPAYCDARTEHIEGG